MFGSAKSKYACIVNPRTGKPKLSKKGKKCLRSFKVLTINGKPDTGRSEASGPSQAASKLFSSWCKKNNKGSRCSTTIRVVETTRGGKGKTYGYNASRAWARNSTAIKGKTINFKFTNKMHSQRPHQARRSPSPVKRKSAHKGGNKKKQKKTQKRRFSWF